MLQVGDCVAKGQLLVRLDDRIARADLAVAEAKVAAAKADESAAEAAQEEGRQRSAFMLALRGKGCASLEELSSANLALERLRTEREVRREALLVAEAQRTRSKVGLDLHEIRSPVDGVIRFMTKRPGEAVKRLEPILFIEPDESPSMRPAGGSKVT